MTQANDIYRDLTERTSGEIYIGVVGPVRSGKSTLVRRFMEQLVIPNMAEGYDRQRAFDELPQSAGGRTVMTTEPKFVPDEAVSVCIDGVSDMKLRLIDCVGYLIPGVLGDTENGEARLVSTPWSDEPMPFEEAAHLGTKLVITEHSTVGLLVTCDGSISELPRESYVEAEERAAEELTRLGKPFVIVLNSKTPESEEAEKLALSLEKKYNAPVALVSCIDVDSEDIEQILRLLLPQFPIRELTLRLPEWLGATEECCELREGVTAALAECAAGVSKMGDIKTLRQNLKTALSDSCGECAVELCGIDMGQGTATVSLTLPRELFYRELGAQTGLNIDGDAELFSTVRALAEAKRRYDKYATALEDVAVNGYGIVMPQPEDMTLDEPQIVKQAGGYGVRLRASAPSIHMIRANIETELSPVVGTEQQSEELVRFMLEEFEENPSSLWKTELFGRSIYELVNEGLHAKLEHMPTDAREKLGETLGRVINEGATGLVCIII